MTTDQLEDDPQNEPEGEGAASSTETDGDDLDLEALLNEGAETKRGSQPERRADAEGTVTVPKNEWDELKQTVTALQSRTVNDDISQGLNDAVATMKGYSESLQAVDDSILELQLRGMADKDSRITDAFLDRHNNPDRWRSIVNGVAKDLASKLGSREGSPAERQAAEAAGRRVSDQPSDDHGEDGLPSQAELARMTPNELHAAMRKAGHL